MPEQLLRYTREGWPRCCGGVMGYFLRPSAGETALDKPALGSDGDTALDRPALPPE